MKKVLLLNPPGDQFYLRDYFCSKVSKSGYLYHPTDLLVLSGILSPHFEVHVMDAIVERVSYQQAVRRIEALAPDYCIFITGSVSFSLDMAFLKMLLRHVPSIKKVVGIGDVFFNRQRELLERHSDLDAIVVDFTTDDIVHYLRGEPCENIVFRDGNSIEGSWTKSRHGVFSYPVPRYDLFPNRKYHYPFTREHPFGVILTNFGCPFQCSFCIMPALGFKTREPENVLEELAWLKKHGFRNVYFNDQTFGADKRRTKQLLQGMIDRGLGLGFVAFTRVDVLEETLLDLMQAAGCHTVMFGIESADPTLLIRYGKGITLERVREVVEGCHRRRIRTLGTFILGLPGETRKSALSTIAFAKDIPLDYAAFNIAIPRMGTQLREQAIREKLVDADVEEMDQSGSEAVIRNQDLSLAEIEALKRRAYREFYFRPTKLAAKLMDIRTREDLCNHVRNGWGVFAGLWRK